MKKCEKTCICMKKILEKKFFEKMALKNFKIAVFLHHPVLKMAYLCIISAKNAFHKKIFAF